MRIRYNRLDCTKRVWTGFEFSQIDYAHSVRGGIGCWIFRRSKFSDVLCVGWVSLLSSVSSVRSADGGLLAVRSHQMTGWRTREPAEISVARLFRRVESVCDRNADISPSGRFPHRSLLYTVLVKRVRIRDRALASFYVLNRCIARRIGDLSQQF